MDIIHPDHSLLATGDDLRHRMRFVEDASATLVGELRARVDGRLLPTEHARRLELDRNLRFQPLEIWRAQLGREMGTLQLRLDQRVNEDREATLSSAEMQLVAAALWEPEIENKTSSYRTRTNQLFWLNRNLLQVWEHLERLSMEAKEIAGVEIFAGNPTKEAERVAALPVDLLPKIHHLPNASTELQGRFPRDEVNELAYYQGLRQTHVVITMASVTPPPDGRDPMATVPGEDDPWEDLKLEFQLDGADATSSIDGIRYMQIVQQHLGTDSPAVTAFGPMGLPFILCSYANRIYLNPQFAAMEYVEPSGWFKIDTRTGVGECGIETTIELRTGDTVQFTIHATAILHLPSNQAEVWLYPKLTTAVPLDDADAADAPIPPWSDRCQSLITDMQGYLKAGADSEEWVERFRQDAEALRKEEGGDDGLLRRMEGHFATIGISLADKVRGYGSALQRLCDQWKALPESKVDDLEQRAQSLVDAMQVKTEWWSELEPDALGRVTPYRRVMLTDQQISHISHVLAVEKTKVEGAVHHFIEKTKTLEGELGQVQNLQTQLRELQAAVEYRLAQIRVQEVWNWLAAPVVAQVASATGISRLLTHRPRPQSAVDDSKLGGKRAWVEGADEGWDLVPREEPETVLTVDLDDLSEAPASCSSPEDWRAAAEGYERFVFTQSGPHFEESLHDLKWKAAFDSAFLFHIQGEAVPCTHAQDLEANTKLLASRVSDLFHDRRTAAMMVRDFQTFCGMVDEKSIETLLSEWLVADWVAFSEVRRARHYRFDKGEDDSAEMHAFTCFKFHTKPGNDRLDDLGEALGFVLVDAMWRILDDKVEVHLSKRFDQEPLVLPSWEEFDRAKGRAQA